MTGDILSMMTVLHWYNILTCFYFLYYFCKQLQWRTKNGTCQELKKKCALEESNTGMRHKCKT